MRELLILLKKNFLTSFSIGKIINSNNKNTLVYTYMFILYIVVSLLLTSYGYTYIMAQELTKYNLLYFIITIFVFIASFTIFILTVYNSKASLFNSKDNDFLLSLPLKSKYVLSARLIMLIFWNILMSFIIVAPAFLVYASKVEISAIYYLFSFLIIILLPIIPTVLASLFGYLIAYLSSRNNYKNIFEILSSFIFVIFVFYLAFNIQNIINLIINDSFVIENIIKYFFYPIHLIGDVVLNNTISSLLVYILLNILTFLLFIFLLDKNFQKITSKLKEHVVKKEYELKELNKLSINKALLKIELKKYFSSPIYVLNTLFGVVVILIFAIYSLLDQSKIVDLAGSELTEISSFKIVLLIIAFVTFVSNTTSATISLEGSKFWILKTLPISSKKIIETKIMFNLLLILPITYLSIFIFGFVFTLTIYEVLALIFFSTVFSLFSSQFGMLANLKFPKMDALSDVVVVKRSMSVLIGIMIPVVVLFSLMSIFVQLSSIYDFNAFLIILTCIMVLAIIIEKMLLNIWGIKRIKEIN